MDSEDSDFENSDSFDNETENKDPRRRSVWNRRSTLTQRITSRLWEFDELDPYQIFKVTNKHYLLLRAQVLYGKNISEGWWSRLVNQPSPYVTLELRETPNDIKMTPIVSYSSNPEWNVCFQFIVDPEYMHDLYVTLRDSGYLRDREIGTEVLKTRMLKLNVEQEIVFEFQDGSKVFTVFSLVKSHKQDLRFSLSLSKEEIEFARKRRQKVFEAMKIFLGPDYAPQEIREVPVIAILCSGGGIRAVTASCGVYKALDESGFLDCAMYVAGLSGSSWYLTYLYTHPKFPDYLGPGDLIPEVRQNVSLTMNDLFSVCTLLKYAGKLVKKSIAGQSVSFADFYGHLIGDKLLGERKYSKLSQLKEKLVNASVPMPLFTCVIAKRNVSARIFQEYVEFSPYEVGLPKYAVFMKTENFGCKFYVGKIIKWYDELPFHYLIGVWGSAFSILIKRLIEEDQIAFKLLHGNLLPDDELNLEDLEESDGHQFHRMDYEDLIKEEETELNEFIKELGEKERKTSDISNEHENYEPERHDSKIKLQKKEKSGKGIGIHKSILHNPSLDEKVQKINKSEDNHSCFGSCFKKREKSPQAQASPRKSVRISEVRSDHEINFESVKPVDSFDSVDLDSKESDESDSSDTSYSIDYGHRKTLKEDFRLSQEIPEVDTNSFWNNLIIQGTQIKWIGDTRAGRAGIIFNPLLGLSLSHTYPISPNFESIEDEDFQGTEEPIEVYERNLCLVDAGLVFNSPYPLLLRPQRAVDVFISFDYSSRPADFHEAFQELILAEKWAIRNNVIFPPIQTLVQKYYQEPMKETYVFQHPSNPYCPIVIHCIIFNGRFKEYKEPNVKRETMEEMEFADFKIFSDPDNPYSSFKYTYTPLQFDRLCKLMEFNTKCGLTIFRKILRYAVKRKRHLLTGRSSLRRPSSFFT